MRLQPPFLVVRERQSFWVETRAPEHCTATRQAFLDGCYRDAWCYDSSGGRWQVLAATLKQRQSFIHRVLPWRHLPVVLELGPRVDTDAAELLLRLADILQENHEFCESLRMEPALLLDKLRSAREPAEVIEIARTYA